MSAAPASGSCCRWTPAIALGIAGDLAFVALPALCIPPLIIRVPVMAVFGWGAAIPVAGPLCRKIALRADEAGVTPGDGPFRHAAAKQSRQCQETGAITLRQR